MLYYSYETSDEINTVRNDGKNLMMYNLEFSYDGYMISKYYSSYGLFTSLSSIGGIFSLVKVFSVVALGLFLTDAFWHTEAEEILRESGQKDEDVDEELQIMETRKKLETRFSYARIFGLFDATTHLRN